MADSSYTVTELMTATAEAIRDRLGGAVWVDGEIWATETLQAWAWDPQLYSGLAGGAIYNLMARDYAPLPERLKSAVARMEQLPGLLAQARAAGWRTFTVVRKGEQLALPGALLCPASDEGGRKVHCVDCKACDGNAGGRRSQVWIPVHGVRHKQVAFTQLIQIGGHHASDSR